MTLHSRCLSVFEALVRERNRISNHIDPPLIVLLYHRVADLPSDPQMLAVSPQNFRDQMDYLKKHVSLMRLDEEWPFSSLPAVAVTFDDGYADNYTNALPILEEFGVPATFFISAGDVGSETEFWWDELERLLLGDDHLPPTFAFMDEDSRTIWATGTRAERTRLYEELHPIMKSVDEPLRTEWLRQLQIWAGMGHVGRLSHRAIDHAQLQRLAASPVATVGAHGLTHVTFSSLPPARQIEEMRGSRDRLETLTGKRIELFSYPFGGRRDFCRETTTLCREAGFLMAAANFPGQVHSWTDRFQLPRHLVRNWPLEIFKYNLGRFWTL